MRTATKYENLRAEMARKQLSTTEMADRLGMKRDALSRRLNGVSRLYLDEAKAIRDVFFCGYDIEYLFDCATQGLPMQILQTIFSYLTPLLALALAAYLFIREHQRKKRTAIDLADDVFETTRAWQRIKALLAIALPNIITDAENKYIDPGTGELKMSYVMAQIMELLPPDWRGRVNDFELQGIIEKALEGARVIWDNLPRTLQRGRLEEIRVEAEVTAAVSPAVIDVLQEAWGWARTEVLPLCPIMPTSPSPWIPPPSKASLCCAGAFRWAGVWRSIPRKATTGNSMARAALWPCPMTLPARKRALMNPPKRTPPKIRNPRPRMLPPTSPTNKPE